MRINDKVWNDIVREAGQTHENDRRLATITEEIGETPREMERNQFKDNLRDELVLTWIQVSYDGTVRVSIMPT